MRSGPDTPQEPPQPPSSVAPHQADPIRNWTARPVDALLRIEPLWMLLTALFVYLSFLLKMNQALPWIGLALACLPFPLRRLHTGTLKLRTPFDIPIALFTIGAIVGLCTSPDRTTSLGPFQCILAATLLYYSWANSPHQASIMKWVFTVAPVFLLVVLLIFLVELPDIARQPNLDVGGSGTHHGLAMYLVMTSAVLLGIAAFHRDTRTRIFAAFICLSFLVIVVIMTRESLNSLIHGVSTSGRSLIWEKTVDLLADSPFTGLGLGCWALVRWGTHILGTEEIGGITHTHNAYLELYANTGIAGALALLIALGIGVKLSLDIIKSPRTSRWYGFGIGVILACVAALLVAIVESAPMGVPLVAPETYYYVVSPVVWILMSLVVVAHRLIVETREGTTLPSALAAEH
jgi:hypothetical protein